MWINKMFEVKLEDCTYIRELLSPRCVKITGETEKTQKGKEIQV